LVCFTFKDFGVTEFQAALGLKIVIILLPFLVLKTTFYSVQQIFFFQCVPVTWDALPQTHYTFLVMNVIMWISLLIAMQKDPGFLAKNTEEYHK
jgi:hypothetical protein